MTRAHVRGRAQQELEQIVERLETGQAPLDETIKLWERGEELYASAASSSTPRTAGSRSSQRSAGNLP